MPGYLIFGFVVYWLGGMFLTGWLASEKNRPFATWLVLSIFFGILATIVLVGAPSLPEKAVQSGNNRPQI